MIYQNVINYCKENSMTLSAFEKKCGIGNGVVGRWKNDDSKPTIATLEKIQLATGIPISEWLAQNHPLDNSAPQS